MKTLATSHLYLTDIRLAEYNSQGMLYLQEKKIPFIRFIAHARHSFKK